MKIKDGGSEFAGRSGHFKFQGRGKSTGMFKEGIYISMHKVLFFQMLGAGNCGKKQNIQRKLKQKNSNSSI